MITVTDKQTKLIDLEAFKSVENQINQLRVYVIKFWNLRLFFSLLLIFLLFDSEQRLIALEFLEKLINVLIDNRDNADNFPHDIILSHYVASSLDDLTVLNEFSTTIKNRVICLRSWVNWRESSLNLYVFRICHWLDALDVYLELVNIATVNRVQICKGGSLWVQLSKRSIRNCFHLFILFFFRLLLVNFFI